MKMRFSGWNPKTRFDRRILPIKDMVDSQWRREIMYGSGTRAIKQSNSLTTSSKEQYETIQGKGGSILQTSVKPPFVHSTGSAVVGEEREFLPTHN